MKYRKPLVIAAVLLLVAGAALVPLLMTRDPKAGWIYHDPKGFSLTLPSDEWRRVEDDEGLPTFANRANAVQVRVKAEPQTRKHFLEKTIPDLKSGLIAKRALILGNPEFVEGENAAGNPYAFCRFQARAPKGGTSWVAVSVTWCQRGKQLVMVEMVQESPVTPTAQSQPDPTFFEQASQAICLSVE